MPNFEEESSLNPDTLLTPVDQNTVEKMVTVVEGKCKGGFTGEEAKVVSLGWETMEEGVLNLSDYSDGVIIDDEERIALVTFTDFLDKKRDAQVDTHYVIFKTSEGISIRKEKMSFNLGPGAIELPDALHIGEPVSNTTSNKALATAIDGLNGFLKAVDESKELQQELGLDFVSQQEAEKVIERIESAGTRPDYR